MAYVDVPPYYGPLACRVIRTDAPIYRLDAVPWVEAVVANAVKVRKDGRPVLIFLPRDDPQWDNLKTELAKIVALLIPKQGNHTDSGSYDAGAGASTSTSGVPVAANPQVSKGELVIIEHEDHVTDDQLARACKMNAITLSSHVAGRGADFVIQNDVENLGGLHVIIAYQPVIEGKLDLRMMVQMKGDRKSVV